MSAGHLTSMSNAAFAGFLRLLLTPFDQVPTPSSELQAYLDYLRELEPDAAERSMRTVRRAVVRPD